MKLFASQAQEIADTVEPVKGSNQRYSDTSKKYQNGFSFLEKLNSALFNGYFHRLTNNVNEMLKTKASELGINIERLSRYNSKAEVVAEEATDNVNYIKTAYFTDFYNAKISPKLLQENTLSDYFSEKKDGFYLNANEKSQANLLFNSTEPIIKLLHEDVDFFINDESRPFAINESCTIGLIPKKSTSPPEFPAFSGATYCTIDNSKPDLMFIQISTSTRIDEGFAPTIITPIVKLSQPSNYKGRSIASFTVGNRCEIIIKNTNIIYFNNEF